MGGLREGRLPGLKITRAGATRIPVRVIPIKIPVMEMDRAAVTQVATAIRILAGVTRIRILEMAMAREAVATATPIPVVVAMVTDLPGKVLLTNESDSIQIGLPTMKQPFFQPKSFYMILLLEPFISCSLKEKEIEVPDPVLISRLLFN